MPRSKSKKLSKTKSASVRATARKPVSYAKKTVSTKKGSMPFRAKANITKTSNVTVQEKMRNPKFLIGIAVVIALFALLYIFKSQFVIAMVNGRPISRIAFNRQLEQQSGKQVLSTMITSTLLEQEAEKKGIKITQAEIDAQAKQIDQQLNKQGQGLDSALAQRGMTKAEFFDQLRLQGLMQKLLGNTIKVSDKEVDDYIAAHQDTIDPNAKPEDTRVSVRSQLEQQKLSQQAQALIAKLQQQAKITYFVNF